MNAARLFEYYDRVADAPDAIGKLRRLIMALAVCGKLLPQDNQTRASDLLEQLASAEATFVRRSRMQDPAASDICSLPPSWVWLSLNEMGTLSGGMTPSMSRQDFWGGDIVWFSPKDIKLNEIFDSELRITYTGLTETRLQLYRPGSLFIVARSGILKRTLPVAISRVNATANQDMKVFTPSLPSLGRYVQLMLQGFTPFILSKLVKTGTTVQSLKYDEFAEQLFPVPPLAEQHQIVAKVDELMAICDDIEAKRSQRETARDRFASATLAALNALDPDPGVFSDHARFAINSLDVLTTRGDQINQLRETILNLAVGGKLVPQDETEFQVESPRDAATTGAIDERVFRRYSATFQLPQGWRIVPLAKAAEHVIDCPHSTPKWTTTGEICVRTNQLHPGRLDLSKSRFVGSDTYLERVERLIPQADDILYSREGGILGVACRIPFGVRLCLGQRLMLIRVGDNLRADFLEIVLNSPFITDIAKAETTGGAAPRVNMSTVRAYPIPLPCLSEQARIVLKVDKLMGFCDRLEAALSSTNGTRSRLLNALIAEALEPAHEGTGLLVEA